MTDIITTPALADLSWTDDMVRNARRYRQTQLAVAIKLQEKANKEKEKSEGL